MILHQLELGPLRNFSYVIGDHLGGIGAVIDPSAEFAKIASVAAQDRLDLRFVINTHSHYDHTAGNGFFRERGARLVASILAPTHPDLPVSDGETFAVGELCVRVLATPGHCRDAICLIADDTLFTGDTLFIGECGRTDLPGSDVRAMHHSLLTVLRGLPDHLEVMAGHNYGPAPSRTLGEEKRLNYTLQPRSLDELVAFMAVP